MPYEVVAEKQLKSGSFEIRGTSTRLGNLLFCVGAAFLEVRKCVMIGVTIQGLLLWVTVQNQVWVDDFGSS